MNTTINWQSDSLGVIRAKQDLQAHSEYLQEIKGKGYTRAESYTIGRIVELTNYIKSNR